MKYFSCRSKRPPALLEEATMLCSKRLGLGCLLSKMLLAPKKLFSNARKKPKCRSHFNSESSLVPATPLNNGNKFHS